MTDTKLARILVTEENIKTLQDRLLGVTPGRWHVDAYRTAVVSQGSNGTWCKIPLTRADMDFVATFDPVTVGSLLDFVQARLERDRNEASDRNFENRTADQIADFLRQALPDTPETRALRESIRDGQWRPRKREEVYRELLVAATAVLERVAHAHDDESALALNYAISCALRQK